MERLEHLRMRRAAIDAEVARLEAKDRASRRKDDTRRKILIGAVIMQEMEARPHDLAPWVIKLLEKRLTKPRDRALFNLPSPTNEGTSAVNS